MSRGGKLGMRQYSKPGLRAHSMRYNIDHKARRRLKLALDTLTDHDDALRLAVVETGPDGLRGVTSVRIALERLVYGPNSEFR